MYKKVVSVALLSAVMVGCASTGTIAQSRGDASVQLTQAQLAQYDRQRANETNEAHAQAQKAAGYSETIRQGSSAVQSAVGAINSIKSLFW